jgi:hypothetical protein
MGLNGSIEGSNPSFSVRHRPAEGLFSRSEGWQSGRMRRSRKPFRASGSDEGSNPSPSAPLRRNPHEQRVFVVPSMEPAGTREAAQDRPRRLWSGAHWRATGAQHGPRDRVPRSQRSARGCAAMLQSVDPLSVNTTPLASRAREVIGRVRLKQLEDEAGSGRTVRPLVGERPSVQGCRDRAAAPARLRHRYSSGADRARRPGDGRWPLRLETRAGASTLVRMRT